MKYHQQGFLRWNWGRDDRPERPAWPPELPPVPPIRMRTPSPWSSPMFWFLVGVLVALVTACAGPKPSPIRGTGEEVAPPQGWVEYCNRHPEDKGCVPITQP